MRWLVWLVFAIIDSGAQVVQIAIAANCFWLAAILMDPQPTFPTAMAYQWMVDHGTEHAWALRCLVVGIVAFRGVLPAGRVMKAFCALAGSFLTGMLAVGFYRSNPVGTGSGTYVILTLLSYWLVYQRLFRNA